jgi:hypothetical protein
VTQGPISSICSPVSNFYLSFLYLMPLIVLGIAGEDPVFQQYEGIPMRTNCAPLMGNLFLH